ncbi:MAG: protein-export chaperone SecB [Pseudomonadales bacterium]|nr:protein-export chaperone SecB [Pseudomonadales bacterium]
MAEPVEQQFGIQRIYVKDASFELPLGATVFGRQWKPAVEQELSTTTTAMHDDHYEVVLTLTITGKLDDQPAFLVEVQQAGVFLMRGLSEEQIRQVAGINCPSILFPYAREAVDGLMVRATLPPLMLPPINFEALFQQALAQQAQQPTSH